MTSAQHQTMVNAQCPMPYNLSLETEPLVVVEIRGELSDEELLSMQREVTRGMEMQLACGMRTAVILDFSAADTIAPRQRRLVGEWRAEVRELTQQVGVGMAMVVRSQLIRGVLTAISWFQKEPIPVIFVESFEEGLNWALRRCHEEGVIVPDAVVRRLRRRIVRPLHALGP